MRQTYAKWQCCSKMKLLLCMLLVLFSSISALHADVAPSNVAVNTTFPGSSNKINGSGWVNLAVTWQGDSPTFTAKYMKNGTVIFTESAISSTNTSAQIQASVIGDTNGSAIPITVQIVDSAGRTAEASSQGVLVDTKVPNLTATVTNGPNFSQSSSVRIQITSDKEIHAPSVTSEGVAATPEGSLTTGTSFVYNLQLTNAFANGSHNISISAVDTTEPESGANRGSTSVTFSVGSSVSGSTNINSSSPASPTNASNVTLSGSSPSGTSKIRLMDGGNQISEIAVSGTEWSIGLTPDEGTHSYVAISLDSLDQEVSRSSAFSLIVDRTAPSVPNYDATGIPTQTNQTSLSFTVSVDNYASEVSNPVFLQAYNNGTAVGQKYNVTTSGSPITMSVPLTDGTNNICFKTSDNAGNMSESSTVTSVNKSGSASAAVSSTMVDAYSIPAPTTSMLGGGAHTLTVNFNQAVDSGVMPKVEVVCGGGAKLEVTGSWSSTQVFAGNFNVPANGGASYDGAATLNVSEVKDSFGNVLEAYTQAAAFSIDSTNPTSTINGTEFYVSATNQNVNLSGTVDDGDGSGIDYLTLICKDSSGTETKTNVPLQTGAQSPWSYSYSASGLASGKYTLTTSATDRAVPTGNTENVNGKAGVTIIVDTEAPTVTRVSLNNTGVDISTYGDPCVIASDVSRLVVVAADTGDSGLDLTSSNFVFTLNGPNGLVTGEKTNNGVDTIYFDFQTLTAGGEYTITVNPVDKAGNVGTTTTRVFTLNKSAPDQATFNPPSYVTANKTDANLAQSQVSVSLATTGGGATPSYSASTISVKYNGVEIGSKQPSETELVAKLHSGNLLDNQSHDGSYYITVVPYSTTGISGAAITSQFNYDTQAPVVIESSPDIDSDGWFGVDTTEFGITVSDAPKDIIAYYKGQYDASASAPLQPGDVTWYNGSGSGVNMDISSFSWKMGDQVSPAFRYTGSKMMVDAPKSVSDTAAGVSDVEVTFVLADNVTQGETVPNTTSFTRTFKYDYLAPKIEISTKKGAKYCKNLLTVNGTVTDQGTDPNLQVQFVQYFNGETWDVLQVNGLPAKTASITTSVDISNKPDGNYTVKFMATDRAGNESEPVEFSYVIDRKGPDAPELTIPLPDYTVSKRSQGFKWASVAGADNYVLQISDDSSFNNILNNQTNGDYPGIKGTICTTTEGSFTLPKDGNYYWRVAAIEKCEDGYNISDYSTTRKVVVDSVKPYVVSVSPSPSSSNVVSTGMVTFTIRFSETIDSTVDLAVSLTSAGGQVMKIEKISCSGDTWTGTTVIPKNNSALYDGSAIISIADAADLSGNKMEPDSSHTIVVNTGPAFTTRLFSNPANEYEITIVTKATESLQTAPSCSVKQNSTKTPVTMNFLKDRYYAGSYKIDKDNPGKAYITISGTDLYGMVGNSTVEFTIADVNASARLSVTTASGRATLKAAESATYNPTAVYIIDRDCLESPFSDSETLATTRASLKNVRASVAKKNPELVGVVGLDEVGPASTKLKKCMLYTADVNGTSIGVDSSKVHVYRQDGKGNWVFQGGTLKDYKISAQLTGLGRLALMADMTAPKLNNMSPSNLEKLETNNPEIKGQFVDGGSGLMSETFKLAIDGLQVQNVLLEKDGSFKYQVKPALKKGKHEISCEVTDKAGNIFRKSFMVDAPAEFAIGEFRPYPSPARGNRISFAYNFGAVPESVNLKIYDAAGHVVAKFDSGDFGGKPSGNIRWDLTNEKGKRVANGTYIYRLEVRANGQKTKKRGKFAVLR